MTAVASPTRAPEPSAPPAGVSSAAAIPSASEVPDGNKLVDGMKGLAVSFTTTGATATPSLVVNGSSSGPSPAKSQGKADTGTSGSDDHSQRADSSSETGAKAPSLDGKSVTSGTTFALDEKESLRPDDSASVKAAADDDEIYSIRSSLLTTSRIGSEVARVHRLRIGDMPERRIVKTVTEVQDQGVLTPQSGASGQQQPAGNPQNLALAPNTVPSDYSSMYARHPDEKLLEAMQSPKDRLFLLRLEQDVINFVQTSKEPYMDLPPNNSFCRMLTHKLADYYHMTHSFEAVQGAVRIYRTPFCRVPPSLASIVESTTNSNNNTPPPAVLPKKIMRRGEDDGSGPASTNQSKATSEVGSDCKDKTAPAKEKQVPSTASTTALDLLSLTANVGLLEKSARRHTIEPGREYSGQLKSKGSLMRYVPIGNPQFNGQLQQPYQSPVAQPYPATPQTYATMMPNNAYPQYSSMPAPPPGPPRYPSSNGSMGAYGPPMQTTPPQAWQPGVNQAPSPGPYQSRGPQAPQPQGSMGPMNGIPYPYGQLPANANPHDPKSQHPIPGSYNRHAFNPKTQSFVPGNGMGPGQPPLAPYNMGGPHGSPQIGSPHMAYSGFSSPVPPTQPYMGGPGYGMSRQGSNNSLPAYHPPHYMSQHPASHLPQMPPQMPNKPGIHPGPSTGPGQAFSHLPNYSNPPATLPQKPPSGI
ncbi:hypothetical protein DL762_007676 [Monosporascus cannonballus]|uniref:R3H domain-containing protein n=1 Tax=Monosporascus cannonballus TaxID=155416 RepID=A0ABY0GYE9_9PEZI|nr:hypothetical protein DL762_007676 [Monosporascus cannonballus]